MAKVNIWDIKQELLIFLRNSDIISVGTRGVTTSQDTGTFTGATSYTLATNPTLVKNVRDITVGVSTLAFGTDYTVNYTTGVITFTTAQTGAYTINYDQGTTDKIFPDFPQAYLKLNNFPRIAVDVISGTSREIELGAGTLQSNYVATIVPYSTDQSGVEDMIGTIRSKIMDNKKNFYYFNFITLTGMGPLIVSPFGENKIFQRNQDCNIQFIFEN